MNWSAVSSFPWTRRTWWSVVDFLVKELPHIIHLYGLMPRWTHMWRVWSVFSAKLLPHMWHLCLKNRCTVCVSTDGSDWMRLWKACERPLATSPDLGTDSPFWKDRTENSDRAEGSFYYADKFQSSFISKILADIQSALLYSMNIITNTATDLIKHDGLSFKKRAILWNHINQTTHAP